jgi:hypothetical protein
MASFRLISYVVLNTLVALLGPVVLSSSLPPFHPHTGLGIIQKAWITSIVFAGFLGVVAVRAEPLNAAKTAEWAWVIPAVIFSWTALNYTLTRSTGFATHFSGYDCAIGLQKYDCTEFLAVTIPLARGLSYSAAAKLASRNTAKSKEGKDSAV